MATVWCGRTRLCLNARCDLDQGRLSLTNVCSAGGVTAGLFDCEGRGMGNSVVLLAGAPQRQRELGKSRGGGKGGAEAEAGGGTGSAKGGNKGDLRGRGTAYRNKDRCVGGGSCNHRAWEGLAVQVCPFDPTLVVLAVLEGLAVRAVGVRMTTPDPRPNCTAPPHTHRRQKNSAAKRKGATRVSVGGAIGSGGGGGRR